MTVGGVRVQEAEVGAVAVVVTQAGQEVLARADRAAAARPCRADGRNELAERAAGLGLVVRARPDLRRLGGVLRGDDHRALIVVIEQAAEEVLVDDRRLGDLERVRRSP